MSSELPSGITLRSNPSSSTREMTSNHPPSSSTGNAKQRTKTPSALETALAVASVYIATLHTSLFGRLGDPLKKCLIEYSTYFHRFTKLQDNRINNDYVPGNLKNFRIMLQTLDAVKESKDFKTLHSQMAVKLDAFKREMTKDFILAAEALTVKALKEKFQGSFCVLLASAAQGFIALTGTLAYSNHEAVMDLLATTPTLLIAEPYTSDLDSFLRLYKTTHQLRCLPSPTVEHSLEEVLLGINGPTKQPPLVMNNKIIDNPVVDESTTNNNEVIEIESTLDTSLSFSDSLTTLNSANPSSLENFATTTTLPTTGAHATANTTQIVQLVLQQLLPHLQHINTYNSNTNVNNPPPPPPPPPPLPQQEERPPSENPPFPPIP